jgi:hypothetical protein
MVSTGLGGIIAFSFFDKDSVIEDGGDFTESLTATEHFQQPELHPSFCVR